MDGRAPLLSRWLTAGFTIAFAVSVAAVLFARDIGGGLAFEPRVAAGLSLAIYGALALGGFRPASLGDRLSWWVAITVAHGTLGLLTAWLFGFIRSLGLGAALAEAFGNFAPASLVALVAAPLAALPFRPRVAVWRAPRRGRDGRHGSAGRPPASHAAHGPAATPRIEGEGVPMTAVAPPDPHDQSSPRSTIDGSDAAVEKRAAHVVDREGRPTAAPGRCLGAEEIERLVTGLARTGRFAFHAGEVAGLGHVVCLVRDVAREAVETAARRLSGKVPAHSVVTTITDRVAVSVVTGTGATIAVAARHPGVPVALIELLVFRAAAALGLQAHAPLEARGGAVAAAARAGAADVASVAGLDGESRVGPGETVATAGEPEVAVFLPGGDDPDSPGALAAEVHAAFDGLDLGRLASISVCTAGHRTELRWAGGAGERPAVVAASGAVARAGLARRQVARAAARLEGTNA